MCEFIKWRSFREMRKSGKIVAFECFGMLQMMHQHTETLKNIQMANITHQTERERERESIWKSFKAILFNYSFASINILNCHVLNKSYQILHCCFFLLFFLFRNCNDIIVKLSTQNLLITIRCLLNYLCANQLN